MDNPLVDHQLLQKLGTTNLTNLSRPGSVSSRVFSAQVNTTHTDFVVIVYSNRVLVCVTQCGKIGNLFSVHRDTTTPSPAFPGATPTCAYDVKCILGVDNEESLRPVRHLAEKLSCSRPLLLSLTLSLPPGNTPDRATVDDIAATLLEHKCW